MRHWRVRVIDVTATPYPILQSRVWFPTGIVGDQGWEEEFYSGEKSLYVVDSWSGGGVV